MRGSCDVCAVGGGPDALVAAALLARSGRSVLVVGEGGQPGGIAANVRIAPGHEFPVAPETLPGPDPEIVAELALPDHGLELLAPDPVLTVFGGEGDPFALPRDPERARLALAGISRADAAAFPGFTAELGVFAGFLRRLLDQPPLQLDSSFAEALPAALAALGRRRQLPDLLRMLPMAIRDALDDRFESAPLRAALAGPALTGTRLGPRAPGTAGLFLHFHAFGHPEPLGWIRPPRGGSGAVGEALRKAARAAGAQLASAGGVRGIRRSAGSLRVELEDGREVRCETVVSDASPRTTFLRWAGARSLSPNFVHEVRNIRYRGAAARVGLALRELPRVPPGVIQIGAEPDALERAADAAKYGEIAAEPLVFAFVPSLHERGLAPEGGAVLSATAQCVPPEADAERVLEVTLRALERAFPGISGLVTAHRVLTPKTLEAEFGLTEGSFHQGEPTMDQLYSLRPVPGYARHRTPIPGLYLAGPGTCPYGGLHGVSGRNAARAVRADEP